MLHQVSLYAVYVLLLLLLSGEHAAYTTYCNWNL